MRNQSSPSGKTEGRSNRPSGRQASDMPEHRGSVEKAPSSLHQGQGPDFQTQDPTLSKKNQGVQDLNNKTGFQQQTTPPAKQENEGEQNKKDQQSNDYENPVQPKREKEELPSREKGEKPYIGDNPAETKRQSPKME